MSAEAGFEISLRPTEFAALQSALKEGSFEAGQSGWSGRANPDGNIHSFVSCKGNLNDAHYCSEKVDALLEEARSLTDPAKRKALYDQVQQSSRTSCRSSTSTISRGRLRRVPM